MSQFSFVTSIIGDSDTTAIAGGESEKMSMFSTAAPAPSNPPSLFSTEIVQNEPVAPSLLSTEIVGGSSPSLLSTEKPGASMFSKHDISLFEGGEESEIVSPFSDYGSDLGGPMSTIGGGGDSLKLDMSLSSGVRAIPGFRAEGGYGAAKKKSLLKEE